MVRAIPAVQNYIKNRLYCTEHMPYTEYYKYCPMCKTYRHFIQQEQLAKYIYCNYCKWYIFIREQERV